jgi:hypothetical protein
VPTALTPEDHGRRTTDGLYTRQSPEQRRHRARVAALSRHHPDQPELDADARRDLKVANAAQYVRQLVDSWPPLTDEQRGRLAALLTGTRNGDGDDGAS